jgi:hydrogenase expression/formation protein HypE
MISGILPSICSGQVANHGISVMSKRKGLEFETGILSDTTNHNHVVEKILDLFGKDIHFLRDPTLGGVASVLNEVAGLTVWDITLSKIKSRWMSIRIK